jgi:hypothetical protein
MEVPTNTVGTFFGFNLIFKETIVHKFCEVRFRKLTQDQHKSA